VQGLVRAFLSKQPFCARWIRALTGGFSRDFVHKVWDESPGRGKSKKSFEGLIAALEREGLMDE
jgi:hypothetical protein